MARKAKTVAVKTARVGKSGKPAKSDKPTKKAFPMVAKQDLNKLLEQCLIYQNRASTATGNMGELVREYADKKHLHTGAFAIIKRLHRLGNKDRGKLWLLLAHFDDMREKSGLDKLAQEQGQLLPAIEEDEVISTVVEGIEESVGNVVDYPQPREVDEQAGEHAA
jgi:hypothetical protein